MYCTQLILYQTVFKFKFRHDKSSAVRTEFAEINHVLAIRVPCDLLNNWVLRVTINVARRNEEAIGFISTNVSFNNSIYLLVWKTHFEMVDVFQKFRGSFHRTKITRRQNFKRVIFDNSQQLSTQLREITVKRQNCRYQTRGTTLFGNAF